MFIDNWCGFKNTTKNNMKNSGSFYMLFQDIFYPAVKTFMSFSSSKNDFLMNFRGESDNKLAGKAFLRRYLELFAGLKVVINSFFEGLLEFPGAFGMKPDNVINANDTTNKISSSGSKSILAV